MGSARAGDYGDAALFSLPKIIPARAGGLLRTRTPFQPPAMDEEMSAAAMDGKAAAEGSFPHLDRFNALRLERHRVLRDGLGLPPWEPQKTTVAVPWYAMFTDGQQRVDTAAFPDVFWGQATLEANRLQIPTNPLVPLSEFEDLVAHVELSSSGG